ncbi:MAG: 30S ribosomal protein S13 [Candidatus Parcubacteria bacterium]|nr:30S ribosomal protein S13 [Candidatus Parcubacteria bacterium]
MFRISSTTLPDNKNLDVALSYLYGIGRPLALTILKKANLDPHIKIKNLTSEQTAKLREIIEKTYRVEDDLRREVRGNIKRLVNIGSYRGTRHIRKLPTRGQHTKTNTRTVRGNVRKTVGSGKKKSSEKT